MGHQSRRIQHNWRMSLVLNAISSCSTKLARCARFVELLKFARKVEGLLGIFIRQRSAHIHHRFRARVVSSVLKHWANSFRSSGFLVGSKSCSRPSVCHLRVLTINATQAPSARCDTMKRLLGRLGAFLWRFKVLYEALPLTSVLS